jgi:ActR/RegA family two-component response regulator
MRVLLVDDEVEFVKTLAKRLEMRQLKPDTAHIAEKKQLNMPKSRNLM